MITPPVKNFTAIDPTVNATAFPVPTWNNLTAKENTVSKQGQALLNATAYPFVYGYVPATGLKNTTNYTLAAVGAVGTAVNATATALNFTSPVAGLGNDLAQAINNAIKVRFDVSVVVVLRGGKSRREKMEARRREKRVEEGGGEEKLTSRQKPSTPSEKSKKNIIKKSLKQTTNAVYNLTVGKAINATVYKVGKKMTAQESGGVRMFFPFEKKYSLLVPSPLSKKKKNFQRSL